MRVVGETSFTGFLKKKSMIRKNILYFETGKATNKFEIGGSFISLYNIIYHLKNDKRFNIHIVMYKKIDCFNSLDAENIKIVLLKNSEISFNTKNIIKKTIMRFFYYFHKAKIIFYLSLYIKKNKIDIFHCNDRFTTNIEGVIAAKITGIFCICHIRAFEYRIPMFYKYFINYPKYFLAISNSIKKNLQDELKIPNNKIILLHNWVENIFVKKENKHRESEIFRIIWVGRIINWKGLHILIEALNMLKKEIGKFELKVVGTITETDLYHNYILTLIREKNLTKEVVFSGYQKSNEIYSEYYDLFIHTSLKPEPFGRVIIEAMANGLPVIASKLGGVTDIIEDNVNGLLFDPQKKNDLYTKLLFLYKNKKLREIFVEQSKRIVKTNFSADDKIKTLIEIYSSND